MVLAVSVGRAILAGPGLDMSQGIAERIPYSCHLRSAADFARLKSQGRPARAKHCLVVFEHCPNEASKVAFVASRKGVGGAVQRNRARRRMREVVRRRWSRVAPSGVRMMFVAFRSVLSAPHAELVQDIERLLIEAGAVTAESQVS
jgi:ribonuclease P protein component